MIPTAFSIFLLVPLILCVGYLYLLVMGSLRRISRPKDASAQVCFAIAIPAHDEVSVIARTVSTLRAADYPPELLDVYVVADFCSDDTVRLARGAGAQAFERNEGERGGKGQALAWLFERILGSGKHYDAIVVFDADTQVHPAFFKVMSIRLADGATVVQGNHLISNPDDGWFPALTWAMFLIDNRFQNQGRANLGLSAKNMGDAICFRTDIIRRFGWGEGLTEDYAFRRRLLLEGIRIGYDPEAKAYGEAPQSWQQARHQRARWLRGAYDASRRNARELWNKGWKNRNFAMLDGTVQGFLPSYSSLALVAGAIWLFQLAFTSLVPTWLLWAWTMTVVLLIVYPFLGLWLEKAPLKAHLVIMSGPIFILWRTWLSIRSRFGGKQVVWVRTPRRVE